MTLENGMPTAGPPPWRVRKEPILDAHLQASVDQAGGIYNEEGHYAMVVYAGCADRARAQEIKTALYRSARHLGYSLAASIVKAPGPPVTYQVHYKAIDKTFAKKYVLARYGPDKENWPWNPRARNKKAAI
jgi:hypothetical protein